MRMHLHLNVSINVERYFLGGAFRSGSMRFSARAALLSWVVAMSMAAPASAFEAFDGRIQVHGFFESTARAMNADYAEQWDVTQWQQVLNLEFEIDIIQDTVFILDLLEAYARVEVRYDCIYSRGCGMFRSMNVYGDRAKSLPSRLSNAHSTSAAGGILVDGDEGRISGGNRDTVPLNNTEGFRTLANQLGADGFKGLPADNSDCLAEFGARVCDNLVDDDPFPITLTTWNNFQFTQVNIRGGNNNGRPVQVLGPWLPKNFIELHASLADIAHPFDNTAQSDVLRAAVYNTTFLDEIDSGETIKDARIAGNNAAAAARGAGSRPYTPVPVLPAGRRGEGDTKARGVYIPSAGLVEARERGRVDDLPLNFTESERAWNRGSSQQDEKELKEAYLDAELFDSQLWLRIGKQTIVWGKTELFRSTDQWNPQDLALSSLPSLEESRIGLWAARGVWSFYEVGPFEDVRLEGAFVYDQFESADLGACGEPYTVNLVCTGSFGGFAHGITALGVAGADYPENPWNDIEGYEVGARLEFRWDRFSFAISDYWGYSDLPYVEYISNFERNVDPFTGMPRIMEARSPCTTGKEAACLQPGPETTKTSLTYKTPRIENGVVTDGFNGNSDKQRLQVENNALDKHSANQQIFAFICSTTVGAVSLDPTACAQNAFGSQVPQVLFTISQFIGGLLAGSNGARDAFESELGIVLPLSELHRGAFDENNLSGKNQLDRPCVDNIFSSTGGLPAPNCGSGGAGLGFAAVGQALGQQLTPWQEALLGCGPIWGTQCDDSGIDLLNTEASALLQSFTGWEGTVPGWRTNDYTVAQPGTVGFEGNTTVCTIGALLTDEEISANGGLDGVSKQRLPGCRGIAKIKKNGSFKMQQGFSLRKDGDPVALSKKTDGTGNFVGRHPLIWNNDYAPTDPDERAALMAYRAANPNGNIWQNELAAVSWNFQLLTISQDAEFLNHLDPTSTKKCSFVSPQLCPNIQGLLRLAGVERPDVRAGGSADGRFGRRNFQWHGGSEVLIRFDKRNVLGASVDFAEDRTKSNFSFEFTWIDDVPTFNTDKRDLISEVDEYNLTMSVDRPTFINFLNSNRTFFFNSQWFIQYRDGHTRGIGGEAWNVLATFAATTGYYQDRLLPTVVFVYDIQSVSGAVLPQITYRYNESFSVTFGAGIFMGRENLNDMPINPIGGGSSRIWSQENAYKDGGFPGLSPIKDRDEVFLKVRYTF